MNVSYLDTRIEIKRQTLSDDGFGGKTTSNSVVSTIWANKKEKSGQIDSKEGRKKKFTEIELTVRKKTADTILNNDILKIENVSGDYQITERFDSVHKYFTTIKAIKVG